MLKYEQFVKSYGYADTLPITKALLSGALTQEDIDTKNETFYEIVNDMFYDNQPVREMFLLENGKELCDVVYEDCDLEHKEEYEASEYATYMQFLQDTLSFFLMTSKQLVKLKRTLLSSEQDSQATPT